MQIWIRPRDRLGFVDLELSTSMIQSRRLVSPDVIMDHCFLSGRVTFACGSQGCFVVVVGVP